MAPYRLHRAVHVDARLCCVAGGRAALICLEPPVDILLGSKFERGDPRMALILAGTGQLTQRQLESALLSAANALRGPVDPGDYKAYVFPVMFFKWISDNWDYQHAEAVKDFGDNLTDEIEADYHPFAIPDGCHWDDVFETPVNVGAKLQILNGQVVSGSRVSPV
ncbi:type I restriction-modification system subunit M N-terminal domain-containing protein [Micromonospora sp. NPDC001898]|uniref:type I restriction-modification system subunit M N-terminal domain-containing protein n=1 Tax=Micromonospora sp. NPDC001898 TaxID=3364221 RepID=UPI003682BE2D